nr:hypothetical protein [Treponemataceae bacterium]
MKEVFKRRLFLMCAAALCGGGAVVSAKTSAAEDVPKRERVVEMISDVGIFISKNVESQVGNIRLQLRGIIGSFQFSVMNEAGAFVPLLSGNDEFTSSFFA